MERHAVVKVSAYHPEPLEAVATYLPSNYKAVKATRVGGVYEVLVSGTDEAGWTLDDYVLPRLTSGLYFGKEVV